LNGKNTLKKENKRKKSEQDNRALAEKQTRQRVREFHWTSSNLPRDLDEWLHAEAAFKVGENLSTTI